LRRVAPRGITSPREARMSDITLWDEGAMVGLEMETRRAKDWAAQHLTSAPRQWKGRTLWVDHRVAPDLVALAIHHGLRVYSPPPA
jgi:hypothetical protein